MGRVTWSCLIALGLAGWPAFGQNETAFFPLVPAGGGVWETPSEAHLAVHRSQNRFYTIAQATETYQLSHHDSITGAVVASSTSAAEQGWMPLDLGVWSGGEEILVAWGDWVSSERAQGAALEPFHTQDGVSRGVRTDVGFIAFDIDEREGTAWGITTAAHTYTLTALNLATEVVSSTPTDLLASEVILRDVILDATSGILFCLWQPTPEGEPNLVENQAFLSAIGLADGVERNRSIPFDGYFRMGGAALDRIRGFLYALAEFDGSLYRLAADSLVLDATFTAADIASQIPAPYQVGGAVAVDSGDGTLFLANNAEASPEWRILRFDPVLGRVESAWAAGADPGRLAYDTRLSRLYASSLPSLSVTAIDASREEELYQAPMGVRPYDLAYDPAHDRILLLSEGGELYVLDAETPRVIEKIDNLGGDASVGIILDPIRNRVLTGTLKEDPPLLLDAGSYAVVGTLPKGGSAVAVSPEDGLIFQTDSIYLPESALLVSAATDGSPVTATSPFPTFGRTASLAADSTRQRVYGITDEREAGLGRGIWSFNWITEATRELEVPPLDWRVFSFLEVDEAQGKIIVLGTAGGERHLLIYDSEEDPDPANVTLTDVRVFDLLLDVQARLAVLLGSSTATLKPTLVWVSLDEAVIVRTEELAMPYPPQRMALDPNRGLLWLASSRPSGLHRFPTDPGLLRKSAKEIANVVPNATALPLQNQISWIVDPPPSPDQRIAIRRQDGELAEFSSVLPTGLPGSATEWMDSDVRFGRSYRYRIKIQDGSSTLSAETEWVSPLPRSSTAVRALPLGWLLRVPQEGTGTIAVLLESEAVPGQSVNARLGSAPWLQEAGISVRIEPGRITAPGLFHAGIQASRDTPPGRYSIPILLDTDFGARPLWLFAEVYVPYSTESPLSLVYPFGSRRVTLFTDSLLREQSGNLLVLKGNAEALPGETQGTGVVINIPHGEEALSVNADVVASRGGFAVSVPLPALRPDTVIRAQVTWPGSSTGPGGVSPVLLLPVGGYSNLKGARGIRQTAGPEPALFIRGQTPTDIHPANPTEEDITGILELASETLLADFLKSPYVFDSSREVDTFMNSLGTPIRVLIYAIGETRGGEVALRSGETITSQKIEGWLSQIGQAGASPILILEGPNCARVVGTEISDGPFTIVMSSSETDSACWLKAWASFSTEFFYWCKNPSVDVSSAFDAARTTVETWSPLGAFQRPRMVPGDSSNVTLGGRYIAAVPPDLEPPRVTDIRVPPQIPAGYPMEIAVQIEDNLDEPSQTTIEVTLIHPSGSIIESVTLTPSQTLSGYQSGMLHSTARPYLTVRIMARDQAGNTNSLPNFTVSTEPTLRSVDLTGDGRLDETDLLQWIHPLRYRYRDLLFDCAAFWKKEEQP